jgi:hypothetical protein
MEAKEIVKQAIIKYGDSWWNEVHEDCENETNRNWIVEDIFDFVDAYGFEVKVVKRGKKND